MWKRGYTHVITCTLLSVSRTFLQWSTLDQFLSHLSKRSKSLCCVEVTGSPSGRGSKVIAVLSRPLPRLTRWGRSAWNFSPFPVSIKSSGVLCRQAFNTKSAVSTEPYQKLLMLMMWLWPLQNFTASVVHLTPRQRVSLFISHLEVKRRILL